ncbi:MAG TPA: Bax inhibitor-1/YccA family protein [Nannocystaceae bacterium]|nr:Bax inhibitor-1/YccA family protein [Nannocystaceae bacterium]
MQGYHQEPQGAQRVERGYSPRGELHTGVQQFMAGVYAWMAAGLGVTTLVVAGVASSPAAIQAIYGTPLRWVALFVPVIMAWVLPGRIPNMSRGMAVAMFMIFAAAMGAMVSYVPLVYTGASILGAVGTAVGVYAVMGVFGFVTKRDLSGMGQFLLMAIFGAFIASFINFFLLQSSGLSFAISLIFAIACAGLTAYYNQALKQLYMMHGGAGNLAINGALALYVNFINLVLSLLRLFGSSRD